MFIMSVNILQLVEFSSVKSNIKTPFVQSNLNTELWKQNYWILLREKQTCSNRIEDELSGCDGGKGCCLRMISGAAFSRFFSGPLLCFGRCAHGVISALVLRVMKLLARSLLTVIAAVATGTWWGVDMWGSCEGWRVCTLTHTHVTPCWARRSPDSPLMTRWDTGWPHTQPHVCTPQSAHLTLSHTNAGKGTCTHTHTCTDGELIRTNWATWSCILLSIRQWSQHSKLLITL